MDSYFLDVIRYKEYHFRDPHNASVESEDYRKAVHGKRIHLTKVAAYTAKWVLKYSPLVLLPKEQLTKEEETLLLNANAMFALHLAFYMMKQEQKNLPQWYYNNLLYHFQFRPYDERHFFLIFEQIGKMRLEGNTPALEEDSSPSSSEAGDTPKVPL